MSRPSTEFGMIVTKLLRCFGSAARPLGMETGKALFKLYHFTLPSPTGSTAQHPCEFAPCGRNDVAAPRMKEAGQRPRRYWINACRDCALKASCTTGKERRITRREHELVLEDVQRRLDNNPQATRQRRETVEHPFGTMKARMGATHFLTKTLPKVAAEMALSALAYNLTRVINIVGIKPLIAAIVV
jgi:hypothetical protein